MSSFCSVKFSFIKGPCIGQLITHHFESDATVSNMKQYLMQTHAACDPNTQFLTFVWEEQMQKLSNERQTAASMGGAISITVNVIKKQLPSTDTSSSSDPTIQTRAEVLDGISALEPASNPSCSPPHAIGTQSHPSCTTAISCAMQQGSRVRVEGLLAKPEINGRSGVICGAFSEETGRWTVELDCSSSGAPVYVSIRATNLVALPDGFAATAATSAVAPPLSPSTPAATVFAATDPTRVPMSPPATPTQPSMALRDGLRVHIQGLQAKPELNGRSGTICGELSLHTGRWTVQMDAVGSAVSCMGHFRPVNLKAIPAHNFSCEWLDEDGRVCPKNVDFSRQCPKGHPLAEFKCCSAAFACRQLMCRLCHTFCPSDSGQATDWLVCLVTGCCGWYGVCGGCARASSETAASAVDADDFCTLVRCLSLLCVLR
jgi:hypothetical protein